VGPGVRSAQLPNPLEEHPGSTTPSSRLLITPSDHHQSSLLHLMNIRTSIQHLIGVSSSASFCTSHQLIIWPCALMLPRARQNEIRIIICLSLLQQSPIIKSWHRPKSSHSSTLGTCPRACWVQLHVVGIGSCGCVRINCMCWNTSKHWDILWTGIILTFERLGTFSFYFCWTRDCEINYGLKFMSEM